MTHTAFIGLGSNLDAPAAQIESALLALGKLSDTHLMARSPLYSSPPWGIVDQPPFVNAVAQLSSALSPQDLLAGLLAIERAAGRERSQRWGPRVLDLDLLLYANLVINDDGLRVPHPHLHQRAFVLLPLADIAPGYWVPGVGKVSDLLRELDCTGVNRIATVAQSAADC